MRCIIASGLDLKKIINIREDAVINCFLRLSIFLQKILGKNIMKINGNIYRNGMIYTLMVKMATL